MRDHLTRLAQKLAPEDHVPSWNYDEIVAADRKCGAADYGNSFPGSPCLVANTGLWEEAYCLIFGSFTSHRGIITALNKHLQEIKRGAFDEDQLLPRAEVEPFFAFDKLKFTSLSLMLLREVAPRSFDNPFFAFSMLVDGRGLSRSGLDVLSKMGLGMPHATYVRTLQQRQKSHSLQSRYFNLLTLTYSFSALLQMPCVLWLDNYSNILPVNIPRTSLELFKKCLWTASALQLVTRSEASNAVLVAVPGMPNELLENTALQQLKQLYLVAEVESIERYENSATRDINQIPLSGPATKLFSLDRLHPLGLEAFNIGSNTGLGSKILEWLDEERKSPPDNYRFICVDINIFTRILKVKVKYILNLC